MDLPMPTNSELLTLVRTAIKTRLEGGAVESGMVDGINIRYASLAELWKLEESLQVREKAAQSGGRRARIYLGGMP
jgi:hypothetical protein